MAVAEIPDAAIEVIGDGKWLQLCNKTYRDKYGVERKWEIIRRKNVNGTIQCVDITAVLLKRGQLPQLILVKQYRPANMLYLVPLYNLARRLYLYVDSRCNYF